MAHAPWSTRTSRIYRLSLGKLRAHNILEDSLWTNDPKWTVCMCLLGFHTVSLSPSIDGNNLWILLRVCADSSHSLFIIRFNFFRNPLFSVFRVHLLQRTDTIDTQTQNIRNIQLWNNTKPVHFAITTRTITCLTIIHAIEQPVFRGTFILYGCRR